jgi:soluble lytic murein transglycosylase-like protein
MTYATALVRYQQLSDKVGIANRSLALNGGFDQALQNAQSRFDTGPTRLNTMPASADAPAADIASTRSARRSAPATYAAAPARAGAAPSTAPSSPGTATTGLTPELDQMFQKAAVKHQVPVSLLKAVARAESGFRSDATSPAGAQGLMQLMPATGRGLGVTDPFDPEQSINGGARYLHNALGMFKNDPKLALAAYNAGPNAVKSHGGIPPYPETQNYVRKVMDYARQFGFTGLPGSTG